MTLKFFKDAFVGIQQSIHETPYLGFMTPNGTDSAAEKRKETVRNWAEGWSGNNTHEYREFENVPMAGFQIVDSVSRWSTSNKWFRVVDPRNFQLEISADNIVKILTNSTVINGEIQGDCIWARDGGTNVLVPVNSPEYTEAKENTVRATKTVRAAIGDKVRLKDGTDWFYLGEVYAFVSPPYGNDFSIKKMFAIYQTNDAYDSVDMFAKNPVTEITEAGAMKLTAEEALKIINDARYRYSFVKGQIEGAFLNPTKISELEELLEPLSVDTVNTGDVIAEFDGERYLVISYETRKTPLVHVYAQTCESYLEFSKPAPVYRYGMPDVRKKFTRAPDQLWKISVRNKSGEKLLLSYLPEKKK